MNDSAKNKIFNSTDCISEQMMFDYIDNKLSAKESHTVEKHLLDCELCSEALEGLELVKNRKHIEIINQKVNEFIAINNEKKIISINYKTFTAIAAGLLLLIGGVFFFKQFTSNEMMNEKSIADLKEEAHSPAPIITEETSKSDSITSQLQFSPPSETIHPSKNKQDNKPEQIIDITGLATTLPVAGTTTVSETNDGLVIATDEIVKPDELKKVEKDSDKDGYSISAPATKITYPEPIVAKENAKKSDSNRAASGSVAKTKEEQYDASKSTVELNNTDVFIFSSIKGDSVEMPEFPGGKAELDKYINKHLLPVTKDDNGLLIETIYILFTIDSTGKAIQPKLLKPQSKEMEKRVVEFVNNMPQWKPGRQEGKAVSVQYNLPIKFGVK